MPIEEKAQCEPLQHSSGCKSAFGAERRRQSRPVANIVQRLRNTWPDCSLLDEFPLPR